MYKLPASLTEEILSFGTLIDDFQQGKIEPVKFKGTRVPMGFYEQRKDGTYMVRIRCTGGYISPEQLRQVALTAQSHSSALLHLTTRQEIQIHNIRIDQAKTILPELQAVELSSKGGGGNTVRNFLVDVNSGISSTELFDVLPYAIDLTTRLISENDSFALPRKLKIAFSTSEEQADFALINDLGFVAKIEDGKRGFKVYLGGSVASNPTLGWTLFDFAPVEELFNITIATKRFFNNHGNRKNKHKARIRYIFFKEGEEKTKELFFHYYNEIKEKENFIYKPSTLVFENKTPDFKAIEIKTEAFELWKKRSITAQKQTRLYSVLLPLDNGNTDSVVLLKIADFAAAFGNDVLRFTPRQQIQLRNIPEAYLSNVFELITKLNINTTLPWVANNVVACTGADTCRLGICLSKGAATALRKQLSKSILPLEEASELQINISGCPNSCAQQLWSDIGFSGKVGRNERMYPAYNVFIGASKGLDARFGEVIGSVSARDLPQFTEDILTEYLSVKDEYTSFRKYLDAGGKENIKSLIQNYKQVPSFADDKNYYYDWGSEELFSVTNRGPAECSAGLFDMIEVDLKFIKEGFDLLEKETEIKKINQLLYDLVFASSRMLLVTRGVEPKTMSQAFTLFVEKFILEGLVSNHFQSIVELAAADAKADLTGQKEEIFALANSVIELYEGMDDSLQFKITVPQVIVDVPVKTEAFDNSAIRIKDLRGIACPMNFVKTKIELNSLKSGELLEVWLDDGQPIQNVPGSVRNEGHEVLSVVQEVEGFWKVSIKRM